MTAKEKTPKVTAVEVSYENPTNHERAFTMNSILSTDTVNLDKTSYEEIMKRANAGIQFDEVEYLRLCQERDSIDESLKAFRR